MSTISRRDFMKTAGVMTLAVAASAALAGCSEEGAFSVISQVTNKGNEAGTGYAVQTSASSISMGDYTMAINQVKHYTINDIDKADNTTIAQGGDQDIFAGSIAGWKVHHGDEFVVVDTTITANVDGTPNEFLARLTPKTANLSAALNGNDGTASANTFYFTGTIEKLGLHNQLSVLADQNGTHINAGADSWGANEITVVGNPATDGGMILRINGDQDTSKGTTLHLISCYKVNYRHLQNNTELENTENRLYATPSITIGVQGVAANGSFYSAGSLTVAIPSAVEGIDAKNLLGYNAAL